MGLRRRVPVERIGLHDLGLEVEPGEVLPEPGEAGGGAVDGGDPRAGGSELRGLAPGGRADLQHLFTCNWAEQTGRQRCRRILHPPLTRLVTSQPRHLAGAA